MFVIVAVKAVLGVEKMNEYQKAYDRLAFNFGLDCLDEKLYPEEVEDFELFRELVEKETPKPLSFEDLKEGMWIWDNVLKEYIHILTIDFEVPSEGLIETENEYVPFEEGRFYRKQVEE